MRSILQYANMPFIVCEVITCESVPGKSKLKKLTVDIGVRLEA